MVHVKPGIKTSTGVIYIRGKCLLIISYKLIRKISDMNWILSQDYGIFKSLDHGIVPEILRDEIREEYHAYEREINHDVTV